MYCAINEVQSAAQAAIQSGVRTLRIVDFYPYIRNNIPTVPIDENNEIPYVLGDFVKSRYHQIQSGQILLNRELSGVEMAKEDYIRMVNQYIDMLSGYFPQIQFRCDDIDFMYTTYIITIRKYGIGGLVNITDAEGIINITDLRNLWMPELELNTMLTKDQFISSLHNFVPEFTKTIIVNDYVYEATKNFVYGTDAKVNPLIPAGYSIEWMSNLVTSLIGTDITAENLLKIMESPVDVNGLFNYYNTMLSYRIESNTAKTLIWYHKNLIDIAKSRVRKSLGMENLNAFVLVGIPTSTFNMNGSFGKTDDVVSII